MTVSPVLSALRAATADAHRALEGEADVEARLRDPGSRPDLVARFLALHLAVEGAVAPWTAGMAEAGHRPGPRSDLIRFSLAQLDARPAVAPRKVATVATLGEAFGWVYVAEGSTLGGRVMRRAMAADAVPLTGLDFLDPHGEETGPRWRAFLTAMDSACASGRAAPADVVMGGRDAFALASTLLVNTAPVEFA